MWRARNAYGTVHNSHGSVLTPTQRPGRELQWDFMHEIRKRGQEKVCRTGWGKVPPKSLECFFSAILQGNCACIPPHSISHPSSPQCSLPLIKREGEGNGGGGGIGDDYRAPRKEKEEEEEGGSFKSDYQTSPWLLLPMWEMVGGKLF